MPGRPRPRLIAATRSAASLVLVAGCVTAVAELALPSRQRSPHARPPARLDITNPSGTTTPPTVPAAGQTTVSGTVTLLRAADAVAAPLRLPVTITVRSRGVGGMTISHVFEGGGLVSIGWDAGQPLPLSGTGSIDLGPASVDADAGGITWYLDGGPRLLTAGQYLAGSPVAVGSGGLPQPADHATFEARSGSGFVTAGGARVHQPPAAVHLQGPGTLHLSGNLTIEDASGSVRHVATLSFGPGPFVLDLTPAAAGRGGYTVTARLQGPVAAI